LLQLVFAITEQFKLFCQLYSSAVGFPCLGQNVITHGVGVDGTAEQVGAGIQQLWDFHFKQAAGVSGHGADGDLYRIQPKHNRVEVRHRLPPFVFQLRAVCFG
jgi:hypothetical protein